MELSGSSSSPGSSPPAMTGWMTFFVPRGFPGGTPSGGGLPPGGLECGTEHFPAWPPFPPPKKLRQALNTDSTLSLDIGWVGASALGLVRTEADVSFGVPHFQQNATAACRCVPQAPQKLEELAEPPCGKAGTADGPRPGGNAGMGADGAAATLRVGGGCAACKTGLATGAAVLTPVVCTSARAAVVLGTDLTSSPSVCLTFDLPRAREGESRERCACLPARTV